MEVTFAPNGILQIDDARIIWRNFSGRESQFNAPGNKNFSWLIEDSELADRLVSEGWNVKIKPPREEDDIPFMHLAVKVRFDGYAPPNVYLVSGNNTRKLDEESIANLDDIEIDRIDMDIRPYDWNNARGSGRTAYLHSMRVIQRIDRFAADHQEDDIQFDME